jgi:hypothetical protein
MAQLKLKQLDGVLTGSLQVSGSSGVTGSLDVSSTGSFGRVQGSTLQGTIVTPSQTNITSVGTIGTGTWEGTTVAVDQGGTGATSLNNLITLTTHTSGNYVGTITGGTNLTSTAATSGEGTTHTLNVDDAFLINDGNDTTSGTITAAGFTTTGHITASGNISASGTIYADNFTSTGGDVGGISFTDDLNITGHITASGDINTTSGRVYEAGTSVIDHATAMAIVFGG